MRLLEREPQLERLRELLAEASRGRGRMSLVYGEAGVGKSSLVATFCEGRIGGTRVLRGACDPIVPPRSFGPLVDIAMAGGGPLLAALQTGERDRVLNETLAMLRRTNGDPVVLVLEDLHWIDDATSDLLRVLGRRLGELAVLVVGTYRNDEIDARHPLHRALGEVPTAIIDRIAVPPLSLDAVRLMARDSDLDAEALHETTAGNAFFITEVIAAPGDAVPLSVRDAVLARVVRLTSEARSTLEAAAIIGPRCEIPVLLAVGDHGTDAIDECVGRSILVQDGDTLSFRHELARRAVLAGIDRARQRALHRRALEVLQRGGGDEPVGVDVLAVHAVGSGDHRAILATAPLAGQRAAAMGAHREAVSHYAAATRLRAFLEPHERAQLLEAHARECALSDDAVTALELQQEALACWRALGDRVAEGACLSTLSAFWYQVGEGERALASASSAVSILQDVDPAGRARARALATLAQRILVAGYDDLAAIEWAAQAQSLAESLGDEAVAVHALTTLGVARLYMSDDTGWSMLEESQRRSGTAGLVEERTRALINLVEAASDFRDYERARRYCDEAVAHMQAHDFSFYHRLLRIRRAELAFEQGRWHESEPEVATLLGLMDLSARVRVRALTLQGRIAARKGSGDPWSSLDEAMTVASPHELQELAPLRAARAEAAWLDGDHERTRFEARIGLEVAFASSETPEPWWWAELAWWAWKSGGLEDLPQRMPEPYRLHSIGDHPAAARAWQAIGCPYQQALALADSTDPSDLKVAHGILLSLDARPMLRRVSARLREMGARGIPRGARSSTRRNPAGLTTRELEILVLLGAGLRNAQIARRLVVSPKTVDHHVSAILRKLGVRDRTEAGREAARLGLQDRESEAERWGTPASSRLSR